MKRILEYGTVCFGKCNYPLGDNYCLYLQESRVSREGREN